jgi:hypothetical protein
MATYDVTLGSNGQGYPTASPDPVSISQSAGDKVRYLSSGPTFTVKFANSPFTSNGGRITPGSPLTMSLKSGVSPNTFKYSIDNNSNGLNTDPDVIVRP